MTTDDQLTADVCSGERCEPPSGVGLEFEKKRFSIRLDTTRCYRLRLDVFRRYQSWFDSFSALIEGADRQRTPRRGVGVGVGVKGSHDKCYKTGGANIYSVRHNDSAQLHLRRRAVPREARVRAACKASGSTIC